jgi:hypothetical protein|tara:strand:- start:51 stop:320 length:270 start_codon:yes stop_codon:yes gene_type:complete
MSVWNEGRYAGNIKWVSQLIYNGGVEELETWLEQQDQNVKDDISLLLQQLTAHIKVKCDQTLSEAEYTAPKLVVGQVLPTKNTILTIVK